MRITDMVPIGIEWFAPWLFVLGTINILYGSLMAWRQTDLKAIVAFSSVGHMGFVLIGISALNVIGYTGALMQMFTHGIITGALFLLVGAIYERAHTREVTDFGGLAQHMPVYAVLTSMAFLASMSLPGLAGFISEIHALVGSFQRWGLWVIIATLGILISAAYSLRTIGRMFMGQFNTRWAHLQDLNARELAAVVPLAVLILVIGVYPGPMLRLISATLVRLVAPFN
jgi:NADH-quinone oxidoreductase subunit M